MSIVVIESLSNRDMRFSFIRVSSASYRGCEWVVLPEET